MPANIYLRNGILWARFKVAGIEYRESLRTRSEATAKKRLKARREEIENAARFNIAPPQSWEAAVVSWANMMEHEVRTKSLSQKTVDRYTGSLREVRSWLDGHMLHQIDAKRIRELVKGRKAQRVTNATIRRDLTALSSVLAHAIDEGWVEENAAAAFPRARLSERRDPIILPDEGDIAYTIGPTNNRLSDVMLFARHTGMRQEEIVSLRHRHIDLRRRQITIVGKRNRLRSIPLNDQALAILRRIPRHLKVDWVFWHAIEDDEGRPTADRYNNVPTNFADMTMRAAKRAAKEGRAYRRFRFHDLRHLFAVEYLRDGHGGIYDLQRILGHASIQTTEIYLAYLTPEQATAARAGVAQKGAQGQRSIDAK